MVIPRVDDCITLLLGSRENRERCNRQGGTYFVTKGWLEGEANIWKEYQAFLARHGPERTERIYQRMLAHYKFLGLIDTGAYDMSSLIPHVNEISAALKLELLILQGTDRYLKHFLSGPWNDDYFAVIPPSTTIELAHLGLDPAISSFCSGCGVKGKASCLQYSSPIANRLWKPCRERPCCHAFGEAE